MPPTTPFLSTQSREGNQCKFAPGKLYNNVYIENMKRNILITSK